MQLLQDVRLFLYYSKSNAEVMMRGWTDYTKQYFETGHPKIHSKKTKQPTNIQAQKCR
jgi:hypothetical protein